MNNLLNTIDFFKEISKIPRESGNERNISEYLIQFAQKRGLFYKRDRYNNVIIKKKTCDKEPVILQAHIDMVCEKRKEKEFNFEIDAIEVIEEDGYLRANETTLGADNGIGVAQILAVLDSNIECNIEAIFTVAEETTMEGAINIDISELKSTMLLNLDGFEENTIIVESASFHDIILNSLYDFDCTKIKNAYKINLNGLLGGHSGFDINKNRGNSNIELARILDEISDISLIDFCGGDKFNVIPSQAEAEFYTQLSLQDIENLCINMQKQLIKKYCDVEISFSAIEKNCNSLGNLESKKFLKMISDFPHGVIDFNHSNVVTTSVNLGGVNLREGEFKVGMRSSRKIEEKKCLEMLKEYSQKNQLKFSILGYQPGFESDKDCPLIQKLLKSHPISIFKRKPTLKSVHITLETGIFSAKNTKLQIAIISPTIIGAHTISEKVELASIRKTDEWLVKFLTSY